MVVFHVAESHTGNREDGGSIPPAAVAKLGQVRSSHFVCVFRTRQVTVIGPSRK